MFGYKFNMFAVGASHNGALSDLCIGSYQRTGYGSAFCDFYTRHQNAVNDFGILADSGSGKKYRIVYGSVNDTALGNKCPFDIGGFTDVLRWNGHILGVDLPGRIV